MFNLTPSQTLNRTRQDRYARLKPLIDFQDYKTAYIQSFEAFPISSITECKTEPLLLVGTLANKANHETFWNGVALQIPHQVQPEFIVSSPAGADYGYLAGCYRKEQCSFALSQLHYPALSEWASEQINYSYLNQLGRPLPSASPPPSPLRDFKSNPSLETPSYNRRAK